ncbi:MAG: patatin-like phospholipase family protein [Candidatus Zixiibacteriota bacterium]
MQEKFIYIIFALFLIPVSLLAGDTTEIFIGWNGTEFQTISNQPTVGLALSGGGARGLAQIGVLKALEENHIRIKAIAGTSMGGIIGGLYASGYTTDQIIEIFKKIDFKTLFSNRPERTSMFTTQRDEKERSLFSIRFEGIKPYIPKALTAGQELTSLLSHLTYRANYISQGDFLKMKIPLKVVTTDIVSGKKIVISSGNLADAIRSTMAFPLAFTGVENGSQILMDGGLLDPIPVDIAREMVSDNDLIIAVNTVSELLPKNKIQTPIDIANQVTSIMSLDKIEASLANADIVVTPEIEIYDMADFDEIDSLIEAGYRAGLRAVNEICKKDTSAEYDLSNVIDLEYHKRGDSIVVPVDKYHRFRDDESAVKNIAQAYLNGNLASISAAFFYDKGPNGRESIWGYTYSSVPCPDIIDLNFEISGNTVFDDTTITNLIDSSIYEAENCLANIRDKIEILYSDRGYDLAYVTYLDYDQDSKTITIEINEAIIDDIVITGNEQTREWLIRSNLPLKEKQPFSSRKADNGISNIYGTDLFNRVTLNIFPKENGAIVEVDVEEKKYAQFRFGWHWHDEYRSEQFAEFLNDNLLGTGQQFLMHAMYADRRQKYSVSVKADRIFSTWLTYRAGTYYFRTMHRIFDESGHSDSTIDEERYGLEFILGRQIARFGTVTGEIRWEEIRSEFSSGDTDDKLRIRSVTFNSIVDDIDRYPFPTEGRNHKFSFTFVTDILGGETNFNKAYSSVESYFPLNGYINFRPKISIGLINTKIGVPYSELFHIGGHYSFYGFRHDELVGAKMILGNFELRFKLPFNFYLYGRYDTGKVYNHLDQINIRNLRHSYGFSIAYDSPIGPIDFGYGKSGTHPERFYIDIGLAF